MLHSSTNLKNGACARRALWRRQGVAGRPWSGFAVGTVLHEQLQHRLARRGVAVYDDGRTPTPIGTLSPVDQADVRSMLRWLGDTGFFDAPFEVEGSIEAERNFLAVLGPTGEPAAFNVAADGTPVLTGAGFTIDDAPAWARRGPDFDPAVAADITAYRLQPDWMAAGYETGPDGKTRTVLLIRDWKSLMGLLDAKNLLFDPQTRTYCAALGRYYTERPWLPTPDVVRWEYINARHKVVHAVEATPDEWMTSAVKLWVGCVRADAVDVEQLAATTAPRADTCAMCPYAPQAGDLDDPVYEQPADGGDPVLVSRGDGTRLCDATTIQDDALRLWTRAAHHAAAAKELRAELDTHLAERTELLDLGDGTLLGPHVKEAAALPRKSKRNPEGKAPAMKAVMDAVGDDWTDHFEPAGQSVTTWVQKLPTAARVAVDPFVKWKDKVSFLTVEADEYVRERNGLEPKEG